MAPTRQTNRAISSKGYENITDDICFAHELIVGKY